MSSFLFDRSAVAEHAEIPAVMDAVEQAFAAHARGESVMPAKTYIDLPAYNGDFRSMPAYIDVGDWDAAGVKWVNVHPDNPDRHDLPTVLGMYIYSDPATARPLAVMDGIELTKRRTAAAAGVATDHLAIPEASTLGIIGAGAQSHLQVAAIAAVRPIESITVADRDQQALEQFVDAFSGDFAVTTGSATDAAVCDVLCTLTPVTEPMVSLQDVGPETHINAIGADAPGKQELAVDLLSAATIVIDDYEQCVHSGEINVPWAAGDLGDEDVYAELGALIVGDRAGRQELTGRTVFDSTGLAIQDVAAAHVVYERAKGRTSDTFDFLELDQDT